MEDYLPQFVYGSTDGIVTTFAIVAGAAGANLNSFTILAIGLASVLADGYSMGVSSYLSKLSEKESPYCNGDSHITPVSVGVVTFLSFITMGMVPILPFLFPTTIFSFLTQKVLAFVLALISFFFVGLVKGHVQNETNPIRSGLQTFFIGLSAAILAYLTGYFVGN